MPTAFPDTAVTTTGAPITIAVLSNDTGNGLLIAGFTTPANGSVTIGANNNLIYTPNPGFAGVDSFTYTIVDESSASSQSTVTIDVASANDAPQAVNDSIEIFAGTQAIIPILANDNDPNEDAIILAAITMPSNGTVEVLPDQTVRYSPQVSFIGVDNFQYTISDQRGGVSQASVAINVRSDNQPPIALDDTYTVAVGETTQLTPLANDNDPDGEAIEVIGFGMPANGNLTINSDLRTFSFISNVLGEDGFTYTIRDTAGNVTSAFAVISVFQTNALPFPQNDNVATDHDTAIDIDVLANDSDPDGDPLSIVAVSSPSLGSITVNADQTLLYTPFPGASGIDEFLYTVRDPLGGTATSQVTVTINETSQAYPNGYAARRRVVVPPQSQISQVAENFVLMISLTEDGLRYQANGGQLRSANGFDINFEDTGENGLDFDIEQYDPSTGELRCWVRIPVWDLSQRLELLLYYGNSSISADQSNPIGVWRGYIARWSESGSDTSGNGLGLVVDGVSPDNLIGPAGSYNGNSTMLLNDASFQNGLSEFTIQAIIKADATIVGTDSGILTEGTITGSDGQAGITLQYLASSAGGTPNIIHFKARCTDGNTFVLSSSNQHSSEMQVLHGSWRAGETPKLYIDGRLDPASASSAIRSGTTVATGPFYIGTGPRNSASGGWNGLIDEVRFAEREIPAEIIAIESVNIATPELLYGVGAEEQPTVSSAFPIAVPMRKTISADEIASLDVLEHSITAGENAIAVEILSHPANGSASVVNNAVHYIPNSNFVGDDQFTYAVSNGEASSTASIQITVEQPKPFDLVLPSGKQVLLMNEAPLRTVFATPATIQSAINGAIPGDQIVLRDGTYGAFTVSTSGNESAPIVIVAEHAQGARIAAQVTIEASWLKFDNLEVSGGGHFEAFQPSENLRFDRCCFDANTNTGIRLWPDVQNVRVSRCIGSNGQEFFIYCDVDSPLPPGGPQYVHIDHCFFTGYNTKSCIRLGDTSHGNRAFEVNAVVEFNYFDSNTGHRELIVGKSSKNWVRYNTITGANRGDIAIRQGSYWNVYGNYSIGAGGITIVATENNVYNNYIAGGVRGIWLMSGDNTWDRTTSQRPIYDRSERCIVANNTIVMTDRTSEGIGVGANFGQTDYPVTDCDIVNNLVYRLSGTGPLISRQAETGNRFANNMVSAASGFVGTGVSVADPQMTEVDGVYRPGQSSPVRGGGLNIKSFGATNLSIETDIDGNDRGSNFDIGADQIGSAPPIFPKTELADVGPEAADPYAG